MADPDYFIEDFTVDHYAELIDLAKENYRFIRYSQIKDGGKFVLWRHDCDYSLNRSLRLAQIENAKGVSSTFFLNPHSEFYNINEKSQSKIIHEILDLGHDIGLHFDAYFYDVNSSKQLNELVEREAEWLHQWFGVKIDVFSFHNPTDFLLTCDDEHYGGLINCYSKSFKENISYCSDSNGYWRFRRLHDVLSDAADPCLQVLTHPGWWQETAMIPRDRIARAGEGRFRALMNDYDALLAAHNRVNVGKK